MINDYLNSEDSKYYENENETNSNQNNNNYNQSQNNFKETAKDLNSAVIK